MRAFVVLQKKKEKRKKKPHSISERKKKLFHRDERWETQCVFYMSGLQFEKLWWIRQKTCPHHLSHYVTALSSDRHSGTHRVMSSLRSHQGSPGPSVENETISEQVTQFNSWPLSLELQAQILSQLMRWGNRAWPEPLSATGQALFTQIAWTWSGFFTTLIDRGAKTGEKRGLGRFLLPFQSIDLSGFNHWAIECWSL